MTEAAIKILILIGTATIYGGPMDVENDYIGNPLYCDRGNGLVYQEDAAIPWVAFDWSEYASGRVQCGDRVRLFFPNGTTMDAYAWDAGRLYPWYVASEAGLSPIVVDIPFMFAPFKGLSSRATVVNMSAARRAFERLAQP